MVELRVIQWLHESEDGEQFLVSVEVNRDQVVNDRDLRQALQAALDQVGD